MLYDKSLERDNCGFGLIAHIEGEPSHKVVRTAIHALARMQHRGAILADGKTGDGCGLLLQKPDRFFRIVAQERGWRLAKNYAVGMLFLNKDPELAAAARRIVEEELQRETLSIVGWRFSRRRWVSGWASCFCCCWTISSRICTRTVCRPKGQKASSSAPP